MKENNQGINWKKKKETKKKIKIKVIERIKTKTK